MNVWQRFVFSGTDPGIRQGGRAFRFLEKAGPWELSKWQAKQTSDGGLNPLTP